MRLTMIWMAAFTVIGVSTADGSGTQLPHLVVYLSDDHSQVDSSLYGNSNIPTPQMERLADDGLVFTHAFVASPACAPSRAALLTGLMPARNGAEANHTQPRPEIASLIGNLKDAGYCVAAFGKVAHGKQVKRYGFDHVRLQSSLQQLKPNVRKFLRTYDSSQPLCLFVGTSNPHVPWTSKTTFDMGDVEFPPHHLDTPATRQHRAEYYQEIKELDQYLGELRSDVAQHLGSNVCFVHSSDHGSQWPFGKWNLYDYGTRVPLIMAWPDHIPSGKTTGAMVSWVDLLPTLIDLVGGRLPDDLDGRSFSDVALGRADQHRDWIFTTHTGDGRMNVYPIRSVRSRRWKLIHNLHPEWAHTNHSDLLRKPGAGAYWNEWSDRFLSDERATGIINRYYKRPQWEFYDLESDPWEQQNLVNDPNHEATIGDFKHRLNDWMLQQGDQRTVHADPRPLENPNQWHPRSFPDIAD
ncbi:Arylsulfatase [Crateriforma conspicua]|uniref:Arylsulfatase n=1 Tax=Crateriforma conspicua TaxID=2527996 RepID=A0A5C6FPZ4_9PLAN|nr:sulfatase [Crateriforma conspicua]TWU65192.1 Arylsulfatase [Crateriforma conspicua]